MQSQGESRAVNIGSGKKLDAGAAQFQPTAPAPTQDFPSCQTFETIPTRDSLTLQPTLPPTDDTLGASMPLTDGSVDLSLVIPAISCVPALTDGPVIGGATTRVSSRSTRPTSAQDCWLIYDAVKATGCPNFQAARIALPHGLHISRWRQGLAGYHDRELCDFLEFGFPINYVAETLPRPWFGNHASARDYPQAVRNYLSTECELGAMLGPYDTPPLPFFHTSPMMTRPKKSSDARRVIVDLSWPNGASVNSGIPRDCYLQRPYKLQLPTVDNLVSLIIEQGRGCYLYSTDIARCYRQLRSDPLDWPFLGLSFDGYFYCDMAIPFGLRWGAMAAQRTTEAVCHLMSQTDDKVLVYIDDFAGVAPSREAADAAFTRLQLLLAELGLEEAILKRVFPHTSMPWIGIEFDTLAMEIRIPQAKLTDTLTLLRTWAVKTAATRHQLQQLLGKLFHIAQCCKPARLFLGRMLDTLRSAPTQGDVPLDADFQKDIHWFLTFLPTYNGIHMMQPRLPEIYIDADSCLSGCGAICAGQYYHRPFPDFIVQQSRHISQLEMLNLVIAMKVWAARWHNQVVTIYCDNSAAVTVLSTGRSKDSFLLACAREIWWHSAKHDLAIQPRHRPGASMQVADALSRLHLRPDFGAKLAGVFTTHTRVPVDDALFAFTADV